nr:hypothetical protein GCM10020093_050920 [Planobispora longispora]
MSTVRRPPHRLAGEDQGLAATVSAATVSAATVSAGGADPFPIPADESERLRELVELEVVEAPLESILTAVAELATRICHTPIALVNLVGEDIQHLKGRVGLGAETMDRQVAFCPYTICGRELMEVPDALADPRFHEDPLVAGEPRVRFYAGAPLIGSGGHILGTVCVMDRRPRRLSPERRGALIALATCTVAVVECHHHDRRSKQIAAQRSRWRTSSSCSCAASTTSCAPR